MWLEGNVFSAELVIAFRPVVWRGSTQQAEYLRELVDSVASRKQRIPVVEFDCHAAQRVDINSHRGLSQSHQVLRRTVPSRGYVIGACLSLLLRQAEVDELHQRGLAVDHDVFGFDVPMDNALLVQILEAKRALVENAAQLILVDAVLAGCVELQQVFLHEVGNHADALRGLHDIQHANDVGVVQARQYLQLLHEQPLDLLGVVEVLHRHNCVGLQIQCLEDLAKVSATRLLQNLVASVLKTLAGLRYHIKIY